MVRLILYSMHNKWYQSRLFVLGGYDTVYIYDTIHVYGIIHEYGGDGNLYLRDSLL